MAGYQLDVTLGDAARAAVLLQSAAAIDAAVAERFPSAPHASVSTRDYRVDRIATGVRLSAPVTRSDDDEHLLECVACILASPAGRVFDRHAGRAWEPFVLDEWLRVAGLLSGRALAINEGRISRRSVGVCLAAESFESRARALTTAAQRGSLSDATRTRLFDELSHWACRPALSWSCADALAALGDFTRLDALARTDESARAFALAAAHQALALPFFSRALDDADPSYRRAAALVLHRLHTPAVLPLVARALADRRSIVREAVLEADLDALLALEGAREALAQALARLEEDPSSLVRRTLAKIAR